MEKLIPEKLFPTERAVPGHRMRIVATLVWPVTGLLTGTPVLVRKLTAPQRERRTKAAALRARQTELDAQAAIDAEAAFRKKLAEADPAKRPSMIQAREASAVAARQIELDLAKAARKEARSHFGDSAGAAALLLVVGGPLVWSLARDLIEPGIGLAIGGWWIAALIHAPTPGKKAAEEKEEGAERGAAEDVAEQPSPTPDQAPAEAPVETPAATAPTPADARRTVALLGADGTHVALTILTAHLAAEHPLWKRSGRAVRALLQEAGIRVRDGVKVAGVSVPGIHHDDVPPLPSPSESAPGPVVVPGQSNNNNHNNATEWSTREGFVMRADPDNPARTIIVRPVGAA
ncbi:hypothetical protein [Streptomyces sp. LS1784]|uniref:hypothetical protein n=1 Tax=Streptomyces sp. LS1784 TaxID=2851533 RepID=UPI001CD01CD2|nr:hypothetical protein [Streptomyces sp. LS1784]